MYGAVPVLPRPGLLHTDIIIHEGFESILVNFWLPIVAPKTITMLLTTCLYVNFYFFNLSRYAATGIWFIRVFFASMQQKYERFASREEQPVSPESQPNTWKNWAKYISYRTACFINNHGIFVLVVLGIITISLVLILTLVFQAELLRSDMHRLILIGTINGFTAFIAIIVSITFVNGVAYHLDEIKFSYETVVIVRRAKRAIPLFFIMTVLYMVIYFLWGFKISPISCLRLHFPFQDVYPKCGSHEPIPDSVPITIETFLWFLIFVEVPPLIITICFRRIPRNATKLHLIPVSESQSEISDQESEDTTPTMDGRTRSLSAVLSSYLQEQKPANKRLSLDHSLLSRSPGSGEPALCINIVKSPQTPDGRKLPRDFANEM
jgi:hypothetical protein